MSEYNKFLFFTKGNILIWNRSLKLLVKCLSKIVKKLRILFFLFSKIVAELWPIFNNFYCVTKLKSTIKTFIDIWEQKMDFRTKAFWFYGIKINAAWMKFVAPSVRSGRNKIEQYLLPPMSTQEIKLWVYFPLFKKLPRFSCCKNKRLRYLTLQLAFTKGTVP